MSRTTYRALLTAPLLSGALLLSACGGGDEAAVATTPAATSTTPPAAMATTPATTSTTPATSPEGTTPASTTPKKAAKDDAAATTADPAAAAETGGAAPAAADTPTKLTVSADRTQNKVLKVLTAVETCWAGKQNYRDCDGPTSLKDFGVKVVVSKRPKPGEVAITNSSRETFKIIGTDRTGIRWILAKDRSGDVTRKCKLADGKRRNPATW